jgi:hypothetical protein
LHGSPRSSLHLVVCFQRRVVVYSSALACRSSSELHGGCLRSQHVGPLLSLHVGRLHGGRTAVLFRACMSAVYRSHAVGPLCCWYAFASANSALYGRGSVLPREHGCPQESHTGSRCRFRPTFLQNLLSSQHPFQIVSTQPRLVLSLHLLADHTTARVRSLMPELLVELDRRNRLNMAWYAGVGAANSYHTFG